MGRLRDKIILVTGAAGGIGSVVADAIVGAGGVAVTTDLKARPGIDHAMDVTQEADWTAVIDRVAADHGRLDGLVNAAGVAALGSVEQTDMATWRRVIDINVMGTVLGTRAAWGLLRVSGGSVVNLSSVSGLIGGHNFAAYNAAKGAVRQFTRAAALDGARQPGKIRVNAVHPAFIEGPMVDSMMESFRDPKVARERMAADLPLNRFGRPEEVAACVLYLLSDESAFVTGASYVLDGGLTAK
jgi:NAD(P)-dependent dehydrogenase (short-subunit alcohol dehydrogenase family)